MTTNLKEDRNHLVRLRHFLGGGNWDLLLIRGAASVLVVFRH
jgi:hypothetical protein